ncbi:MAG TPA: phosphoribosylamine--glycine ligase [Firmicutes bacterium]|nr:phosphoribosylamine--glycine ligase [Bacillales bacterium]HJA40282.1 phosphoribosylamine--glycine ligase [Bacillota bacterium]
MNILIIGSGGREHAMAQKAAESKKVKQVFVAPGNDGMTAPLQCVKIDVLDFDALIAFAKEKQIALTLVGPEVPLMEGIVDRFMEAGLKIFGPKANAALLEGSKGFAKDVMKQFQIPTAAYETFTDLEKAENYIRVQGAPIVIKADGLAAGKGVVVAMTEQEALQAVREMLAEGKFGASGNSVVIEEFLEGQEFSLMSLVHDTTVIPLEIAQDHKRVFDGDKGPNTGGMGAYSPVPQIPDEAVQTAMDTIVHPTVQAMKALGRSFTGILYAGLILTKDGPKVIEFNVRFGDPETQPILMRLKSDLIEVLLDLLDAKVTDLKWKKEAVIGVVMASKGYPGDYEKGFVIEGLDTLNPETGVFHAGTKREGDQLVNAGGRVLLIASAGETLQKAQKKVYQEMKKIKSDGLFYRTDIGAKAFLS